MSLLDEVLRGHRSTVSGLMYSSVSVVSPSFIFANTPSGSVDVRQLDQVTNQVKPQSFTVHQDGGGLAHCEDGPAIRIHAPASADEYYWHGVLVPEFVVMRPHEITVEMIDAEKNAEVMRVMVERYGRDRYMKDCKAKLIKKDKTGELYEKKNRIDLDGRIRFVKVKNSTPEPDGSIKDYFLRVPPDTKTPTEGIAWTFGLAEKEYNPELQT